MEVALTQAAPVPGLQTTLFIQIILTLKLLLVMKHETLSFLRRANMKRIVFVVAVVAGFWAFVGTSSATIVTWPNGTAYTGTVHATSSKVELHSEAFSISCKSATITASVSTHGSGITASGPISTIDLNECNFPVTVLAKGTLEGHATGSGGNATFTSSGAEITIHGSFGINCLYKTNATDIGLGTGSTTTGSTAVLDLASSLIPRTGDSAFCGATAKATGSFTVTTPDGVNAD